MKVLSGVPNPGAWAYLALSTLAGRGPRSLQAPFADERRTRLVLVRESEEALEDVADAIAALAELFEDAVGGSAALFGDDPQTRLASFERLHAGARLVLATESSLLSAAPEKEEYARSRLVLRPGTATPRAALLESLDRLGYQRADFVESPGEYAARGAVVDFYPFEPARPLRALFDGDEIATLKEFDASTQTTKSALLEEAVVVPAFQKAGEATLAERLSQDAVWLHETGVELPGSPALAWAVSPGGGDAENFGASPGAPAGLDLDRVAERVRQWRDQGFRTVLYSLNAGESERLREIFEERLFGVSVEFRVGPLRHGFVHGPSKLAVATSAEIFGRSYRRSRQLKPVVDGAVRVRWRELKTGDYVVHEDFGIARYNGLEAVTVSGGPQSEAQGEATGVFDCLKLEFRGGDRLFVPLDEFRKVQKYGAADGQRARLSSLDTRTWEQVKTRVREGVREMAEELLKAAAARRAKPGNAFPPDSHMEAEFAESFPFEETPDQRKAIIAVKTDMEAPHPMDRLVVGDVGFGKTEVAMRAALKCASGLKQTAVLVPTTILADQHARTFKSRFADYPVRVEMLSRFQSAKQQKEILVDLAAGKIDVIVGTHRLLSKDVTFRDLGLVIVDEEHRFGVEHKEKVKQLRLRVDCLTLSATPIPRTLHQGLSGLREISLIQSAPTGRQPILTEVLPYGEGHVKAAVEAELARGGQVFYVHNRVRSLPQVVGRLQELLPGVRIVMAHGQMKAERLETAMWEFFERKFDVLVASTIIESGLDIPSVNTLLIENAQDFGLSQLYQLRGRIGRERRRAYCYLYYPGDAKSFRSLSEDARKRLEAMREFGELGSGLALAMRDLEIRGTGDLLGSKQHGYLNAVGVEFYAELLEDEIRKMTGKKSKEERKPAHVDVSIPAYIPEDFLPGDLERIRFYKRILATEDADIDGLRAELIDLSGPLPAPVANLFQLLHIRARATERGIRSVVQRESRVEIYFRSDAAVPMDAITRWMGVYKEKMEFVASPEGDGMRVSLTRRDPIAWILDFLEGLRGVGKRL
ncbi:MAG: transcription-repair coupling factor [Elusimicrobia bacterium CG1_02_63_36]|nr:MAG: transcription-repair coupling factor [Elusimicrobia bacterium CG1_02_63_36]PIP84850.1 MAG: transcription-repair coupling factor [Elusimicrobia bacterium CG22_combo_CG10-13_8_21_14_all_63_91]PJA11697.1 MAG: transcription-repair coupling factor [Elusimicrobia bacterium CG_4_10_14_0_2_um_filter_63_34]PJB23249.1 MAG: transcription-repair coupling factor [Elusimicrobia bacterium CG_4_9_14_3_um_filter_62_55]